MEKNITQKNCYVLNAKLCCYMITLTNYKMVYREGQKGNWIQPCEFRDGVWIPIGRPFVTVRGQKTGKTKATKQKEKKEAALKKLTAVNKGETFEI